MKEGTQRDSWTRVLGAALLTVAQRWEQCKCPSTDEGIQKMWDFYTHGYYFTLKQKEILTHTTIWMNLEGIMLSEQDSDKKTKTIGFHLYEVLSVLNAQRKQQGSNQRAGMGSCHLRSTACQ